ncbi:type IV secretory system conjugative DNA transfer family protein [Longirhabdus pacifica]|uniref:type IV secretory system conjugative DNA transfer family protein n=1 Tax=Longirhabdus pacifica TaxID=2305227 RepID=UPI001008C10E|nr:type IV secretion system DNA-binding domain-containing protein [Longirhabdus pacifica]
MIRPQEKIVEMFHFMLSFYLTYQWYVYTVVAMVLIFYGCWKGSQYVIMYRESQTMNIIRFILPKDNENEPHQMNIALKAIWNNYPWYFRLFRVQPWYAFEIHAEEKEITFNVVVQQRYTEKVEKVIHSVYKDAESQMFAVGSKQDYMQQYNAHRSVTKMNLSKHYVFSIQTFKDWTQDPLSTITSSMTKLDPDQAVTLQVMCRPKRNFWWQYRGRRILRHYEATAQIPKNTNFLFGIVKNVIFLPFRMVLFVLQLLFVSSTYKDRKQSQKREIETIDSLKDNQKQGQVELKEQKAMSGKITQHGFTVDIRIITKDQEQHGSNRRKKLSDVTNALQQLDAENQMRRKYIVWFPFLLSFLTKRRIMFMHSTNNLLSTDELASLFHLPNKDVLTPNIKRIKSKQQPPPVEATREQNVFGESRYRGKKERIGIKEEDLNKSIYVCGKQGTGKSQLLENLYLQQVRSQPKVGSSMIIDPTGDMAKSIIGSVSEEEIEHTYYLNFADYDFPPSLNMLDKRVFRGANMSLMQEQFIGVLKKEFKDAWGASTEDILRNAVDLAMVSEHSSILEVMLAIMSEEFRATYLQNLDNFVVRGYWRNEFEELSPSFRNQATNAPLNKLRRITGNFLARNILCQSKSTVDLADLFARKKNIVVNLAKGSIGEENSRFLGSLLISYVYLTTQEREFTMPVKEERPKITLFVDELQNYVSESVADMLAELRKYGLRMVAGHQYRSQFDDEKVKEGVYQLSRTKIYFNVGESDAEFFSSSVSPRFTASDLTSLEKYQCIVKLCVDDYEHEPFSLFTLPPLYRYDKKIAKQVIEHSRKQFFAGEEAIQEIEERYNRFVSVEEEEIESAPILKEDEDDDMLIPIEEETDLIATDEVVQHDEGQEQEQDVQEEDQTEEEEIIGFGFGKEVGVNGQNNTES